jgi:PncC family amidohydrolase
MTMTDTDAAAQAARCGAQLLARGLWLGVAESCTGGLLGHWLTEVPGASRWFRGGIISYDNSVKQDQLGVPADLLATHGAVSAECAAAMAAGARARLHTAVALAITGIAGPDGATPTKPVGTVYVALAADHGSTVRHFCWPGDRSANKRDSAEAALDMLEHWLEH